MKRFIIIALLLIAAPVLWLVGKNTGEYYEMGKVK